MKRSRSRIIFALCGYLFALVASFLVPVFSQPAHAADPLNLTFFYNLSDKEDIKAAIADNPAASITGLAKTAVYIKGGDFGPTPMQFVFVRKSIGGVSSDPIYQATYYCTKKNRRAPGISSANEGGIDDVKIVLSATPKLGLPKPKGNIRFIDPTIPPSTGNSGSNSSVAGSMGFVSAESLSGNGAIPQDKVASECLPEGLPRSVIISNYNQLNAATKAKWPKLKTSAQAEADANAPDDDSTASAGTDDDAANQCPKSALGIGFIVCPFIGIVNDLFVSAFQKMIVTMMHIDPLDTSDTSTNLYGVWKNIRDLANVLFLLIFMVIVVANTLSFNIQAYTLKKMIPKLVAAAVLVQFSFIISAILIDIFNVIGGGLGDLLTSVANIKGPQGGSFLENLFGTVFSALTVVLGATIGTLVVKSQINQSGVIGQVAIGFIIVLALMAFFAFMSLVFSLMFRKLLIVILIITSPLAFAAIVLPSTEKMFKVWIGTFLQLLMMYPMIVFLFASATILQTALGSTANDVKPSVGIPELMAAVMPIVVCFMVPLTFKAGGKLMSAGANGLDGLIRGTIGGAATGKFKESGAYQIPRAIRKGNIEEKRQKILGLKPPDKNGPGGRSMRARLARANYAKTAFTARGDISGGKNLGLRVGIDKDGNPIKGWRGLIPRRRPNQDNRLAEKDQRTNFLQNGVDKLKRFDRDEIESQYHGILAEGARTGDYSTLRKIPMLQDQLPVAMAAMMAVEGKIPRLEVPGVKGGVKPQDAYAEAMKQVGMSDTTIAQNLEFINGQNHNSADGFTVESGRSHDWEQARDARGRPKVIYDAAGNARPIMTKVLEKDSHQHREANERFSRNSGRQPDFHEAHAAMVEGRVKDKVTGASVPAIDLYHQRVPKDLHAKKVAGTTFANLTPDFKKDTKEWGVAAWDRLEELKREEPAIEAEERRLSDEATRRELNKEEKEKLQRAKDDKAELEAKKKIEATIATAKYFDADDDVYAREVTENYYKEKKPPKTT